MNEGIIQKLVDGYELDLFFFLPRTCKSLFSVLMQQES